MNKSDEHIYLYAKGWYKKGDAMDDLKTLISHRSGLEKEHITKGDVITVLLGITYKQLMEDGMTQTQFMNFVEGLNPSASWLNGGNRHDDFNTILINRCLSVLRFAKMNAKKTDPPNPNILPLSKNGEEIHNKRCSDSDYKTAWKYRFREGDL